MPWMEYAVEGIFCVAIVSGKIALALADIRKSRQYAQKAVAERLGVNQAEVSKLERRADMYVSTLRNFIEALGGVLEIYAFFPEGEAMRINQFDSNRRQGAVSAAQPLRPGSSLQQGSSSSRAEIVEPEIQKQKIMVSFRTSKSTENLQQITESEGKLWIWSVCGSSPESTKKSVPVESKK